MQFSIGGHTLSTEKIIIKIADGNRVRAFDPKGLLQVAAYKDAVQALDLCLNQAVEFWNVYDSSPASERDNGQISEPFRVHSAIFVEGKRGAGKTSFMVNLDGYWDKDKENRDKCRRLYFLKPIDPTLLNNEDNFLNVVISQIYKIVSSHKNCVQPDRFWKDFDKVAEALEAGSQIGNGDVTGGDRILATRDYAKLEENLTQFFVSACRILRVDALVIAIDDIDMDLQWGFKVLEVVRRYLASPLVIPVISGELDQYEMMVMAHFAKELNVAGHMANLSHRDLLSALDAASDNALLSKAKHLSGEYLKKILPPHQRIRILPVTEILRGAQPIVVNAENIDIPLNHIDVQAGKQKQIILDRLSIGMSYKANGIEGSRPTIKVETTRELIHVLLIFHRHGLLTKELSTTDWKKREQRLALANAMREYWRSQDDLVAVERAKADIQLLSNAGSVSRFSEMSFFNPMEHDQKIAAYDLQAQVGDVLTKMDKRTVPMPLDELPRTLMPMPSFEPIHQGFFIGKDRLKNLLRDERNKFYINIYSHHGYYTSNQQTHLLFFGRAFDLIMSNLLGWTDVSTLRKILSEPPYWSHFYFHSTKTIDGDGDADDDAELEGNNIFDASSEFGQKLAKDLKNWQEEHVEVLTAGLSIQTVYKITNKFFNQVNLYKSSFTSGQVVGTLEEVNDRFKLVLLNAVSSFESQEDVVVRQNFGLRNLNTYKQANVWTQNIAPLLGKPSLTDAIFNHPLFMEENMKDLGEVHIGKGSGLAKKSSIDEKIINDLLRHLKLLKRGDQVRNTNHLKNVLGEELWTAIWGANQGNAGKVADQLIADIQKKLDEVQPIAKSIAAQILFTAGNPGQIRKVMEWAGRLDELIKLLLVIK